MLFLWPHPAHVECFRLASSWPTHTTRMPPEPSKQHPPHRNADEWCLAADMVAPAPWPAFTQNAACSIYLAVMIWCLLLTLHGVPRLLPCCPQTAAASPVPTSPMDTRGTAPCLRQRAPTAARRASLASVAPLTQAAPTAQCQAHRETAQRSQRRCLWRGRSLRSLPVTQLILSSK